MYKIGIRQAQNIGADVIKDEVTNIKIDYLNEKEYTFKVETLNNEFKAKSVILATGNKKNKPNIKNMDKYEGKGISYCAICDGFFYRNKNVAVIGNGDYAIAEAKDLQNIAKSITILTNGRQAPEYRAENININTKEIDQIEGENKVEEIDFVDNTKMKIDGIFIAQGVAGSTEFAKKIGAKINNDKIVVDENMETSIKGLFACGDCTGGLYQVSKAVYDGTKAGLAVLNN